MIQRFQKPANLFRSFRRPVSVHRRAIVRGSVLVLAVIVVPLVTLIATGESAKFGTCDCSLAAYTDPLAYDSTESMTITGGMEACASAGAHDACLPSAGVSNCNSYPINKSLMLGDCGGALTSAVSPRVRVSDSESCTKAKGSTSGTSSHVAVATSISMSASFATASGLNSNATIEIEDEVCCPGMPCAGASASVRTTSPITITIPFELCDEQLVTVSAILVLQGSCGSAFLFRVSGGWSLAGHGGGAILFDVGIDEDTEVFTLGPGEYTFSASYQTQESVSAGVAGCAEPGSHTDDCIFSDSWNVNVNFADP